MRVLVTRPEEDASALVAALHARGHEALVEPMLTVTPAPGVTPPLDLEGVQALLFTSANGVRALARLAARRDLPVFTVGDASAEAARAAGFVAVVSAGGDVDDLARLVVVRLNPAGGALYQAAANQRAGDLKGALEAAGFTLRREVLYETVPVTDLSGTLRLELATGQLAAATFFSPRTAEIFVGLVEKLGLSGACAETTALCLSEAVAEPLRKLDWRALLVAERPNQVALLARLDELAGPAPAPESPAPESPVRDPAPNAAPEDDGMTPGQRVIARFGGIRPMAGTLAVAVSTVQGWRERGAIPLRHHARVLEAARAAGLEIGPADLGAAAGPATATAASAPAPKPAASAASRAAWKPASEPPPKPEPRPETKPETKPETAPKPKVAQRPPPRPEPSPPSRPRSEPVARSRGGRRLPAALFGALLVIVGAGAVLFARDLWVPLVDPEYGRPDGGALMALERRFAELESATPPAALGPEALAPLVQSLAALEDRVSALADPEAESAARFAAFARRLDRLAAEMPDGAALAEVTERTEDLAARIEDVAARPDPAPAISTLTQQVAELTAARNKTAAAASADAAFSLAVLQLRAALQGSGPFAAELGLLRDLAASGALAEGPAMTALTAPLAAHAETGVPSLAGLKAEFPAAARAALIAARGGAGPGWWAGVVRRLSDLVILRPVGRIEGASAGAVLARAETWIRADDLPAALDELAALEGPAAEALRAWREAAGARAAARQALAGLGGLLVARLRAAAG